MKLYIMKLWDKLMLNNTPLNYFFMLTMKTELEDLASEYTDFTIKLAPEFDTNINMSLLFNFDIFHRCNYCRPKPR